MRKQHADYSSLEEGSAGLQVKAGFREGFWRVAVPYSDIEQSLTVVTSDERLRTARSHCQVCVVCARCRLYGRRTLFQGCHRPIDGYGSPHTHTHARTHAPTHARTTSTPVRTLTTVCAYAYAHRCVRACFARVTAHPLTAGLRIPVEVQDA